MATYNEAMLPLKSTSSAVKRPHRRMLTGAGRRWAAAIIFAAATALPNPAVGQVISTVAGGGSIDGYPAVGTTLPIGNLGFDRNGNLYVVSGASLLSVSPAGTLITIAGEGAQSSSRSPDGGAASIAIDVFTTSVCFDANDDMYITDTGRIRKIATNGAITTVAGTGTYGSSGDGGPATVAQVSPIALVCRPNGELYFFDVKSVRKITSAGIISTIAKWNGDGFGGDGGSALLGNFYGTRHGLAVDTHGNVYIADSYNRRVRKIDTNGILSTFAGNGTVGFSGDGGPATNAAINIPMAVVIDADGNLLLTDSQNQRIRRVAPDGIISTIAGTGEKGFAGDGGPAIAATLNTPTYLAINPAGELHFHDGERQRIRKVTRAGTITTVMGGDGPYFGADGNSAISAILYSPTNPLIDANGNLYLIGGYTVRKISPNGRISTVAGNGLYKFMDDASGDGGQAIKEALAPSAIAVDRAGNLFIASNRRVRKVTPGGIISTVAGNGQDSNGVGTREDVPATSVGLGLPRSLLFDAAGNLLIGGSGSIRKVTPSGIISTLPVKAAETAGGSGMPTPPPVALYLSSIDGMALDARGNLFFVNTNTRQIYKVAPDGMISIFAGNGQFMTGFGGDGGPATSATFNQLDGTIAFDHDGNLHVTDSGNNRIRKITPDGIIFTAIGTGESGFSGDGGDPIKAKLNYPKGVAADTNGDIYVGDAFNNRIRKISTRGGANYSDMWWASSVENGWGMSIQQHASGAQFNALFVYDDAGQPRWYVMPGGSWSDGFTTYTGQLYQPTSSPLNNYQTSAFAIGAPVGLATIRFSANRAELSYTIDGITASKRLVRMQFGGGSTALDVGDMWWSGVGENGWGINIAQQGGTLFSVWYTYGSDGKSRWFPMLGGSWTNNIFSGPLYSTNSSRWLGSVYDPTAFKAEQIGTMSLRFSGPDAAQLNYVFSSGPFAGTNQTKAITRMVY